MQSFDVTTLPHFQNMQPQTSEQCVIQVLNTLKQRLQLLLAQSAPYTWEMIMQPLEEANHTLHRLWSPIEQMHAVMQSEEWRKVYNTLLPLITQYDTDLSQNEALFKIIQSLSGALDTTQQKIIANALRDFKLAGVHLPQAKKARFKDLQQQLNQLTTLFSENVLDATQYFTLPVSQEALRGLPEQAMLLAQENAKQRNQDGYVLTLDYPLYSAAMQFLEDRTLRKTLYQAYITRASNQSNQRQWDNSSPMENILKIRHEMACLVGFHNYAEYSLATKSAQSTEEVLAFLNHLLIRSKPLAEKEYHTLQALAQADGVTPFEPWDTAFYTEKLRAQQFHFTQEALRPYFPITQVWQGLFDIVHRLYGITIREHTPNTVWHPDVKFYVIYDSQEKLRGGFYADLYARLHKREGAWVGDCQTRRYDPQQPHLPVAFLTCNFMPPMGDQPALLTHDDVTTLFHEFGHCLHHVLTLVNYPSLAGTNGVLWDTVEFPSQFMENYLWEKESLALLAKHYQTQQPLPDALYTNLLATKTFQAGLAMVRQLEFALFDFRLHLEYDEAKPNFIQTILNEVRQQTAVIPVDPANRFQHSFLHIFAGGYAAGYYSYKWAEVLAADAFEAFQASHIFDHHLGLSFMQHILEVGGVPDPIKAFTAFRGRKPTIDALLKQNGITLKEPT